MKNRNSVQYHAIAKQLLALVHSKKDANLARLDRRFHQRWNELRKNQKHLAGEVSDLSPVQSILEWMKFRNRVSTISTASFMTALITSITLSLNIPLIEDGGLIMRLVTVLMGSSLVLWLVSLCAWIFYPLSQIARDFIGTLSLVSEFPHLYQPDQKMGLSLQECEWEEKNEEYLQREAIAYLKKLGTKASEKQLEANAQTTGLWRKDGLLDEANALRAKLHRELLIFRLLFDIPLDCSQYYPPTK